MARNPAEYSVFVDTDHHEPLTDDQIDQLVELGGAIAGAAGDQHSNVAVNIDLPADTPIGAAVDQAVTHVQTIAPGIVVAVEVITVAELQRRHGEPAAT